MPILLRLKLSCIFIWFICVLPAYSALPATATFACPNPIKVGYNDWAPYAWQDPHGEAQGLDVELMRSFAQFLGCDVSFINVPAKRSHQMLKAGTLDMMMGATKTQDRQEYALFSEDYRNEEVRLFVLDEKKEQIHLGQWQDIFTQKLRLIVPTSGWYGNDYHDSRGRLEQAQLLVLSPSLDKSVQMLYHGRADIVIGDSMAVPYIASQYQGVKLVPLKLVLEANPIHLMLSKASMSSLQLTQMNTAIRTLKDNGEIARVLHKWLQISLAKQTNMSRQYHTQGTQYALALIYP
ncbi:substrate-binding periplasmic protein [Shewanella sp. HN-41]|uniref:substrate-binding periplasmic protein n=1 Tax=Shewanella sp. HN-41 TaxID=327275 RepID=UPI0002126186|nr:extracellular solute-binding protein, family 3 protein [Shewanella sp. HN-41]